MPDKRFSNLCLNFFLIPRVPLIARQEDWKDTVEFSHKYSEVNLGRSTRLYYNKGLKSKLDSVLKSIQKDPNIVNLELRHETSYSGMPYQISCGYNSEYGAIDILFDGMSFYMTKKIETTFDTIQSVMSQTRSELGYRNVCMRLIRSFGFEVYAIYNPFWDFCVSSIGELDISTDSEYPAFRIVCTDQNFFTSTNYGDKQVGTRGEKYLVYFSEDVSWIRTRISHDMIVGHDLENMLELMKGQNRLAIEANSTFISSLKKNTGGLFTFFRKNSSWRKVQKFPDALLDIESILPKYRNFFDLLGKEIERRSSYQNVPPTIWTVGDEPDKKLLYQREVPNFFELSLKDEKISIENDKPISPLYRGMDKVLAKECRRLEENVATAVKNLGNATTLYSTNFGFDALWVAILALLLSAFPFNEIIKGVDYLISVLKDLVK